MFSNANINLVLLWLAFGVVHSLLAAAPFKNKAMVWMKSGYKYYRLLYSLFASVNLAFIVGYHCSINSSLLWQPPVVEKILAAVAAAVSSLLMLVCMKKYFADLSGIDALTGKTSNPHLEQTGLHAYVRHPLYTTTLFFVWGIFLWQPSLSNGVSCACITTYTRIGVYFEEKKLLLVFGNGYALYKTKVPMLLPRLLKMVSTIIRCRVWAPITSVPHIQQRIGEVF